MREQWPDQFREVLLPCRIHEQQLSQRRQFAIPGRKQNVPNEFAGARTARLARNVGLIAPAAKPSCKQPQLRALSRPINTFDCDKQSAFLQ